MTKDEFKQFRHFLGLSITEAAKEFRVSPRHIRRWEDGTRLMSGPATWLAEELTALAKARRMYGSTKL